MAAVDRSRARRRLTILACAAGAACGDPGARAPAGAPSAVVDRALAERRALDTLGRLGSRDFVADSFVVTGDTVAVWTGPRTWMATDRPMSVVRFVPPARIVAIEHVPGG